MYIYRHKERDKEFQMTHHTSCLWAFHLSQQDVSLIQVLKQHLSPGLTCKWGNLHGTCISISVFLTTHVFCKKESHQAVGTELRDRFAAQEIQGKKMTRWQANAQLERQSKYGCRITLWCPMEVNFLEQAGHPSERGQTKRNCSVTGSCEPETEKMAVSIQWTVTSFIITWQHGLSWKTLPPKLRYTGGFLPRAVRAQTGSISIVTADQHGAWLAREMGTRTPR